MSMRRALLAVMSAACLLVLLSMPAAARRVPLGHPSPMDQSRPALKHGNRVQINRSHITPHASEAPGSQPRDLVTHDGFVYFSAYAPGHGYALWKSDTFRTPVVKNDIDPFELAWAGNQLFFGANDGTHGDELWVSNGTSTSTHQITDAVPGPDGASIYDVTAVGNKVYYQADDGVHGYEPWVSDGTPTGTHMLKDLDPGPDGSNAYYFTALGNKVVFEAYTPAHGRELWISNGTSTGTRLLKDIQSGPDASFPYQLTRVGSRIVFTADDGLHGFEPWATDGTRAGTQLIKDIAPGTVGSYPDVQYSIFTTFNGFLYFTADDGVHNAELWKTDGTPAHTKLAVDMRPGPRGGNPYEADATNNALYIAATDGVHGYELWKSDGTKAGTAMLKDIWPGFMSSDLYLDGYNSAPLGNKLLFVADDGTHGYELWVTNGTSGGTKMVKDIWGGPESASPFNFVTDPTGTIRGTVVFFVADSLATGQELWFTDGTNSGTHVIDIYPEP
jgi:ELWxxDGT repeat protein